MVHFVWDLGTGCGQEESHIFMSAPLQSLVYQGAPEVTGTIGLFVLQIICREGGRDLAMSRGTINSLPKKAPPQPLKPPPAAL